jgi:hypothetical protein
MQAAQSTMGYHLTPVRMAVIKTTKSKFCKDMEKEKLMPS